MTLKEIQNLKSKDKYYGIYLNDYAELKTKEYTVLSNLKDSRVILKNDYVTLSDSYNILLSSQYTVNKFNYDIYEILKIELKSIRMPYGQNKYQNIKEKYSLQFPELFLF